MPNFYARTNSWHETSNVSLLDYNSCLKNLIDCNKEENNEKRRRSNSRKGEGNERILLTIIALYIAATTTITKTTTTTAATVTITSNTCTSGWKGVTVLYHCNNCPDIPPYTQYTYTYTAISNRTRIAFSFREDEGCFVLDAVSVRNIAIELIANNDFETATLSSWTYCNSNSTTSAGAVMQNSDHFECMANTYQVESGNYFYYDGAVGNFDYLIQMFSTLVGQTYTISYWLYNQGSAHPSSADVIISI
ncbi:unnamed protein product [Rotaria sp. Silwood2]|nr:unnamed protein product [Rotaria sp. Silwood2]CAF2586784.1 unnamed protein product [Rotaria sp. Silwood2]CAF2999019.1 unnamed protein product [Rotaria sp. Silwood2]CAF3860257.1 unnamed protein product [Rotaria sp. Silwood2]CAF3917682.1 unnamed protein product [Rotaria sp. Silwood2]